MLCVHPNLVSSANETEPEPSPITVATTCMDEEESKQDEQDVPTAAHASPAVVSMMQRRLTLPLLALFPALDEFLSTRDIQKVQADAPRKISHAEVEKEQKSTPATEAAASSPNKNNGWKLVQWWKKKQQAADARAANERCRAQEHNSRVLAAFMATECGQASVALQQEQERLEQRVQKEVPHIADKISPHSSAHFLSSQQRLRVPAIMLGEEKQRKGALVKRDQVAVWEHLLAMLLSLQTLFSASTTMSVSRAQYQKRTLRCMHAHFLIYWRFSCTLSLLVCASCSLLPQVCYDPHATYHRGQCQHVMPLVPDAEPNLLLLLLLLCCTLRSCPLRLRTPPTFSCFACSGPFCIR